MRFASTPTIRTPRQRYPISFPASRVAATPTIPTAKTRSVTRRTTTTPTAPRHAGDDHGARRPLRRGSTHRLHHRRLYRVLGRVAHVSAQLRVRRFHDDSFAFQTIDPPDWMFLGRMEAANALRQWRSQPIGGELMPTLQHCAFSVPSCSPAGQEFARSVEATHASWLLDHYAFRSGHVGGDYDRAIGKPLVFANAAWGHHADGWLTLGRFRVRAD